MAAAWQDQAETNSSQLAEGLLRLGVRPGMEVMAHTSLSALGKVNGGAAAVIEALQQVVSPRGVLLLPAFTLYNMERMDAAFEFDVRSAPVDVGKIPETFRSMAGTGAGGGVGRSIHPSHSVCAWGNARNEYLLLSAMTGFGVDSPFDLLAHRAGHVLLLGVGFRVCTLVHYVEAICGVPYREFYDFSKCTIVDHEGRSYPCRQGLYRRRFPIKLDLEIAGKAYLASSPVRRGKVGNADALLIDVAEFTRIVGAAMRANPEMLVIKE